MKSCDFKQNIIIKLDVYEFTVLLDRAKKGNQLSVFSNRTDEASATQYFQVFLFIFLDIFNFLFIIIMCKYILIK